MNTIKSKLYMVGALLFALTCVGSSPSFAQIAGAGIQVGPIGAGAELGVVGYRCHWVRGHYVHVHRHHHTHKHWVSGHRVCR